MSMPPTPNGRHGASSLRTAHRNRSGVTARSWSTLTVIWSACGTSGQCAKSNGGCSMITAIVLYDLPPHIDREACRQHFLKIAPDFLDVPGFVRKQFIYDVNGGVAG